MAQIFAYILHKEGVADDSALELVAAAKKIDAAASVTAIVVGSGVDAVCNEVAASYNEVWKIDGADFAYPNAEVIRKALVSIVPKGALVLIPHNTFGMDLGPGLSVKLDTAFVSDVVDFEGIDGDALKVVRQEYSGMVSTHVTCDTAAGAIITVRPGAFQPDESKSAGGAVTDKTGDAGDLGVSRRFLEVVEAEMGDVDITKSEILVSVGRGIEDEDNLEIAQELADAMGADVSCSRPIVDAKWMEKSRQVGTSGQTVSPKVYLACGISGSFQHMGGIKGAPFIVAINKNAKAPIFQLADVGVVADILEFLPDLAEAIEEAK
ncbi:electron transfer flavoprotein subunit alpha [Desulfonema ishimotonii]|uniref:Electron transfer flavoprotein subunit alpha n=1 Tax=Desulfonema ishimotonii TaxID=45657 RepID=A0A401FRC6_9BACT|nr:electron transfer flavoprotein subunit alpha/FixB family protein [Desulfonema ishimotonii]GBC59514.1 electron transfer flavoprotein subunit alpha [Desulfonema ishimotonii]